MNSKAQLHLGLTKSPPDIINFEPVDVEGRPLLFKMTNYALKHQCHFRII
jgi:hypothetical protein